jgi:hypothetical protein
MTLVLLSVGLLELLVARVLLSLARRLLGDGGDKGVERRLGDVTTPASATQRIKITVVAILSTEGVKRADRSQNVGG